MRLNGRRILVLGGKTGLLGQSVTRICERDGAQVLAASRKDFDPADEEALARAIAGHKADTVINTIAYTAVDKAEDEPGEAGFLNRVLAERVGRVTAQAGAALVHYSTDFVFDGKASRPYREDDPTGPECVYGSTKLAGERALFALNHPSLTVIRVAWLFGPGKVNFVEKILGFAATRDELKVVHDQIGSPTCTVDIAQATSALLAKEATGLFHFANAGSASWCELAAEACAAAGLHTRVTAITSAEWPQKAKRPAYSVLDTGKYVRATGESPRPWLAALREYVFGLTKQPVA